MNAFKARESLQQAHQPFKDTLSGHNGCFLRGERDTARSGSTSFFLNNANASAGKLAGILLLEAALCQVFSLY